MTGQRSIRGGTCVVTWVCQGVQGTHGAFRRAVPSFKWDEALCDGEVDEIEVKVREAQVVQGFLAGGKHVLEAVVRVPQLASDPQVRAGHQTVLNGTLDSHADLLLVAVVARCVNVPHARLDCLVHHVTRNVSANLPCAKADGGDRRQCWEVAHRTIF